MPKVEITIKITNTIFPSIEKISSKNKSIWISTTQNYTEMHTKLVKESDITPCILKKLDNRKQSIQNFYPKTSIMFTLTVLSDILTKWTLNTV